jgi:class 3 adenylate cyclase/tetratricopeptide (TPR) repeat protein
MTPTLGDWLRANDLGEFEKVFADNEVDLKTLKILTDVDLKELGLGFGPRKRILNAVTALRREDATRQGEAARPPKTGSVSERRQLTVMFCDLVGSTALSTQLDPEELRELIQTYRKACGEVVARYDGHVAQYLGDGLLVYFGWPRAYEDAAERGVRSGLEIVRAVNLIRGASELSVRVGLTTGTVVVGEASCDDSTEAKLAVGEAPNLAARLMSLAGPNEVVIGHTTRCLLGDVFTLANLGAQSVKGFAEPVPVWRVEAVRRAEGRFDAVQAGKQLTDLVGRDEELALLRGLWEQARQGRGQAVLVSGEAGIGKSRLCHALRKGLAEDHRALRYQCSPHFTNSALYPIIEQLELAANLARDDSPAQRLDKLEALLAASGGAVAEAEPLLADLLSLPTRRYPPLNLSPQRQKEKTLEALVGQIEALSGKEPVLIAFEDLHWVDPTSQAFLDALVERLPGLPVLLVATHRPDYSAPWEDLPQVTSLPLGRLEPSNVTQFVNVVTRGLQLPPEVLEEIISHTDGVPLFIEELTKSVLESGLLCEAGDKYTLAAPLPAMAIPTSLRDSLAARLDRLAPVKEIAQIGACIGREFSRELLHGVAAWEADRLDDALDRLVETGLVSRHKTASDVIYTFKHALVQDAAYDLLLKSRRQHLHARIARTLALGYADQVAHKPELLAHHYTQAGRVDDAIPLWRKAGALAIARVALDEAVAHLQKALNLTSQLPETRERDALELTIREQLNAAWAGLLGWAGKDIGENTARILRLAWSQGNTQSLILGLWWMWTNTITQGRIADSLPLAQRLLDEAEGSQDADLKIFGPAGAMVSHFLLGELSEADIYADQVMALYDPQRAERLIQLAGHDLKTFAGVYLCQWVWMQGDYDRAMEVSDETCAHARAAGHAFNLVWALTYTSYLSAYGREPERLLDRIGLADRLAQEQGLAFFNRVAIPQATGCGLLEQGDTREVVSLLRRGIEDWEKVGGGVRIPYMKSVLAQALALEDDLAEALRVIDESIEQIERPGFQERIWLAEVLRTKGWILLRQGRDVEAEPVLRTAIDCARQQGTKSWELRAAVTLAGLLEQQGKHDAARDVLAPIHAWFNEAAETKDLLEARALLERLSTSSPQTASA